VVSTASLHLATTAITRGTAHLREAAEGVEGRGAVALRQRRRAHVVHLTRVGRMSHLSGAVDLERFPEAVDINRFRRRDDRASSSRACDLAPVRADVEGLEHGLNLAPH
jgi:hypothetical protein